MKSQTSSVPRRPLLQQPTALRSCSIVATGSYLPTKVLTNADLSRLVDTSDEWIVSRTGIRERHVAGEQESTSDLATAAARKALAKAGVSPDQLDMIIVATITPDMVFPSTACLVQSQLGASRACAFDIEAACSGFVYALEVGKQFVATGSCQTVLVIGAEKLSSITDWTDRNTCVLFGDGAGAAVLQHRPGSQGLVTALIGADGTKGSVLCVPAGGSRHPASVDTVANRMHYLRMDGKETFKNAVPAMCNAAHEVLKRCGLSITDVKCVIPHQANRRIIDAVADRLKVKEEQLFVNLDKYGNTSAASVAIALDEAVEQGRIHRGDLVLLAVFGAGFTWGSAIIEW